MSKKIIFSGIQPSGNLHIGNYFGAIRNWVLGQEEGFNIFCIVDLHAITVPQDPKELHEKTLEVASILVASGIDPQESLIFVQSHNPDHANLGWVLNNYISFGQMSRMTQFKEKSEHAGFISVGLFDYPALMAADILLYDTTEVPVGEDQKQHVELARDTAQKFNSQFGETFEIPKPVIPKIGGRVMSLQDPTKKMSKSDKSELSSVYMLDPEEVIRKKIGSAVTDSDNEVRYNPETKPGVSNLIEILSLAADKSIGEIENEFKESGYKEFKEAVAQAVVDTLKPIQKRYDELRSGDEINKILKEGAIKSYDISHKKLEMVYTKVGFYSLA